MTEPVGDNGRFESAVLETMLLLSTLSTAADVRYGVHERRAGRDPSAQEDPEVARSYLTRDAIELDEMLMRLRSGLIYARYATEDGHTILVRRFDMLLVVHRIDRILQSIHQRLLSLYPDVSAELLEEVREVHSDLRLRLETTDGDPSLDELAVLVERALDFGEWMRREL